MKLDDELLDQQPEEERRRQQKMGRKMKMPPEEVLRVEKGAACYKGVVTAITVAGVEVIIMCRNSSDLMIAHQNITDFKEFRLGLVHKAGIMAASSITLDDEL
jgi:methyl coenzyme M reductase subunit C-like uncharacterized protein (methanogenesis marker protein 7)